LEIPDWKSIVNLFLLSGGFRYWGFLIAPDWIYCEASNKWQPLSRFRISILSIRSRTEDIDKRNTLIYVKNDPVHLNIHGHQWLAEGLFPILEEMLFPREKKRYANRCIDRYKSLDLSAKISANRSGLFCFEPYPHSAAPLVRIATV
jgi:hypothetical protein